MDTPSFWQEQIERIKTDTIYLFTLVQLIRRHLDDLLRRHARMILRWISGLGPVGILEMRPDPLAK